MASGVDRVPFRVAPMLATLTSAPFHARGWVFEEKYDGVRMIAYKEGSRISLISRNDIDRTERYPEIAASIARLKPRTLVLDGEIVVFDAKRVSSFQMLQQGKGKPRYAVFDCLYEDGADLRTMPLSERREALEKIVVESPALLISARVAADGVKAFQIATRRGFEGVIGKNLASAYFEGRSREWLKVKVRHEQEFVIGGYTAPEGSRAGFGALLLGVYSKGQLVYVGKVGTGFNDQVLKTLYRAFQPIARVKSPFSNDARQRGATFLSPKLVAQIAFTEWTGDGKLRHPVFLGLRDDKKATQVVREDS